MDSQELKPCPHCGGNDVSVCYNSVYEAYYVRCNDCHMQGPEKKFKIVAFRAWQKLERKLNWSR